MTTGGINPFDPNLDEATLASLTLDELDAAIGTGRIVDRLLDGKGDE